MKLSLFNNYTITLVSFTIALITLFSCVKEETFYTGKDVNLRFSVDTLRFDTVFTELGSATRTLKIYNPHKQRVKINSIGLAGNAAGHFRFNVDGITGNEVQDVEIAAQDSIYVFAEVTVDPDAPLSQSPYVIEDYLIVETNEQKQRVLLEAWGQNANYIPNRFNKGNITLLSCQNSEIDWNDPKPYVIYGVLLIDSCQLNLAAGTKIYVHGGIAQNETFGVYNDGVIWTLNNGKIVSKGTAENPVILQGDRLEETFAERSGQWTGVVLGRGSTGNRLEHTTIKNSRFGILVDSAAQAILKSSQFYNTLGGGIIGFHSTIVADNCLAYNNAGTSIQLIFGGNYTFNYCTAASYGVDAEALGMSNFFCYTSDCSVALLNPLRARFNNSIFFGSKRDEIILSDAEQGQNRFSFNYLFKDCIVRTDELTDDEAYAAFYDFCSPCINGTVDDALFVDASEYDYHLDTLSIAIEKATPISTITLDIEDNGRDLLMPDLGCYEYQ